MYLFGFDGSGFYWLWVCWVSDGGAVVAVVRFVWFLWGFDVGFVGFRFFMVVPWRWCHGGGAVMVRFELVWF